MFKRVMGLNDSLIPHRRQCKVLQYIKTSQPLYNGLICGPWLWITLLTNSSINQDTCVEIESPYM